MLALATTETINIKIMKINRILLFLFFYRGGLRDNENTKRLEIIFISFRFKNQSNYKISYWVPKAICYQRQLIFEHNNITSVDENVSFSLLSELTSIIMKHKTKKS